jgi:hypothetical protein
MLARLVSVTLPDSDGDGPLAAPVTQYAFDAVGNLLEVTDALDNVTNAKVREELFAVTD